MDRPFTVSIPRDLFATCLIATAIGGMAAWHFFAPGQNEPVAPAAADHLATKSAQPKTAPRGVAPAELPAAPDGWVQPLALDFTRDSARPIDAASAPRELPGQIRPVAMSILRRLPATADEPVAPLSDDDLLELED